MQNFKERVDMRQENVMRKKQRRNQPLVMSPQRDDQTLSSYNELVTSQSSGLGNGKKKDKYSIGIKIISDIRHFLPYLVLS